MTFPVASITIFTEVLSTLGNFFMSLGGKFSG